MFKTLTILTLTLLLSASANAQAKKKAKKKLSAPTKTEKALPESADVTTEPTPAPEAAPVAQPTHSAHVATAAGSQFNWQPAGGQSAVQLGLGYTMYKVDTKSATATTATEDVTAVTFGFSYDYGFTSANSIGVSTNLMNNITDKATPSGGTAVDYKLTGMSDIFINSNNTAPMGGMSLQYGLGLGFSPGKNKEPTSTVEGNNYSGGMSVPVYLGVESALSPGSFWGAKLAYNIKMERTRDVSGTDSKITGGNALDLKAFYESGDATCHWNAYLGFGSNGEYEVKPATTAATKYAAMSGLLFGGSWGTYLSPGMLLALHYDGASVGERDTTVNATTKYAAHLTHTLGVRSRFEF